MDGGYTWTLPLGFLFPTSILKEGNKQIVSLPSVSANSILSGFITGKIAIIGFPEFINAEHGEKGIVALSVHPGCCHDGYDMSMLEDMNGIERTRGHARNEC